MGKLIHTIKLTAEKNRNSTVSSTRESASRKYTACLVATTTQKTVEVATAKKAELEKKVADAQAKVAKEQAKWNMTPEQAEAEHKARSERWYNDKDGIWETKRKIREAKGDTSPMSWLNNRDETEALAKADLAKRGFIDPYDKDTSYSLAMAAHELDIAKSELERHEIPTLGSQAVISWHQSVTLAQKATGSREAEWARKLGDTVEIRTDIEIRERATRAKKA